MEAVLSAKVESVKGCLDRRRAGVLLHLTSLPGPAATGDMGAHAFRFVDFLVDAGFSVWQMLPTGPTQEDSSPYQTASVHAGNPRLISLDTPLAKGWLEALPVPERALTDPDKREALRRTWTGFKERATRDDRQALDRFVTEQAFWLDDYALFMALRAEHGDAGWWTWPAPLRDRKPKALRQARSRLAPLIAYLRFEQFLFSQEWEDLKCYANERGVKLFGDMPIFVAHNSAEVWAHRELFDLDKRGLPRTVAGVPPDYFSETGQRWGNPLYDWQRLRDDGFAFWVTRLSSQLRLFDLIRVDHFRGFEAYWEIPAEDDHAISGRWVLAPGDELFDHLHEIFDPLPLVAEDLGIITPEVDALRRGYRIPGMKILQFAFGGDPDNPYLPHNHSRNSVVYTGTHDNDTTLGWYLNLDEQTRHYVDEFLGRSREQMPWPLIRCALASRSMLAILPMQDILALDGSHRMNTPGTAAGNWNWRFSWEQISKRLVSRLYRCTRMYGRVVAR